MASSHPTPKGDVVLILSPAEARGLAMLVGEGQAMLTNKEWARAEIGGPNAIAATKRAIEAVGEIFKKLGNSGNDGES